MPAQSLSYAISNSLGAAGVTINPATGVILWTPDASLVGQTNYLVTTVTDIGVPPLSATNVFALVVGTNGVATTNAAPQFTNITVGAGGVQFRWTAPSNELFQIRWTTNLAPANWQWFPNIITSGTTQYSFVDTNTPLAPVKFYQLLLLP